MQKTVVTYIDDITGKPAEDVETITLSLNGKTVELDLNKRNATQLRRSLDKYLEKGRKVTSQGSKSFDGRKVKHDRDYVHTVRQWAQENGIQVADRGRVPLSVYAQYEKSNG